MRRSWKKSIVNIFRHAEGFAENLGLRSIEIYSQVSETAVAVSITSRALKGAAGLPVETIGFVDQGVPEAEPALGLSVCQALVGHAGGEMRVNETRKQGFTIELEYPLVQEEVVSEGVAPARVSRARAGARSITALVIDDDTAAQDALLYHLAERGHKVIPVASLEEGLDLSERIPFDWVFCNVQMGRRSVLDVYRLFCSRVKRFIFLANEDVVIYNQEFFAGSDRAVLRKPIKGESIDRLLGALAGDPAQLSATKVSGS